MRKILICLLMLIVVTNALYALIDENKYSYEDIDMRIITDDNIDSLYGIQFFDRTNIVLQLQCSSVAITKPHFKLIDKFLTSGGTIWIYDSSAAEKFGFVKSDFTSRGIRGRKINTEYANIKEYPAFLCTAFPAGNSNVLKDVKSVVMNCIQTGQDMYSAVAKSAGDEKFYPLLKINDNGNFVCAYRTWGKGKVVFIAGINEKDFKNRLFVANLKEFSFNLTIPDQADKKTSDALKYKCIISFADNSFKTGFIMNKNLEIFAGNENKIYEFDNIAKIKFLQPAAQDELYFKDGTMLRGLIIMPSIDISQDGIYVEKYGKKDVVEINLER